MGNKAPGGAQNTDLNELDAPPPASTHGGAAPAERSFSPSLTRPQKIVTAAAAAVVLVLVVVVIWLAVTLGNYSSAIQRDLATIDTLTAERDAAQQAINGEKNKRQAAERERNQAAADASKVASREAELTTLEAAAAQRTAELEARESAVAAREAAALANRDYWWVEQVRECLARPGSYRMGSATEGSLGRDVSCMSG